MLHLTSMVATVALSRDRCSDFGEFSKVGRRAVPQRSRWREIGATCSILNRVGSGATVPDGYPL